MRRRDALLCAALLVALGCGRTEPHAAPSAAPASSAPVATTAPRAPPPSSSAVIRTGNLDSYDNLHLPPARRRVVTVTMALKPGGPSEVIEVNEQAHDVSLRVRRVYQDGKEDKANATLSKAELDEVWQLVSSEHLTNEEPPETDPAVMDGAGHMLLIEWPDAEGRAHVHALHWSNPKQSSAGIDRLFQRMAGLARQHAASVKLFYYPQAASADASAPASSEARVLGGGAR